MYVSDATQNCGNDENAHAILDYAILYKGLQTKTKQTENVGTLTLYTDLKSWSNF